MACCMLYRGDVVPKDVNAAIAQIKTKSNRLEKNISDDVILNAIFQPKKDYSICWLVPYWVQSWNKLPCALQRRR